MRVALIVLALFFPSFAGAAEPLKSSVSFIPYTSGGRNVGCGLEYTAIFRDTVYRQDQFSGLVGGISWLATRDRPGIIGMFKLAGVDFDDQMRPTPFKVNVGVLRIGGALQTPVKVIPCEVPQNYCGAYSMDQSVRILAEVSQNPVEMGYNRSSGGLDVMVPFSVGNAELLKLLDCVQDLAANIDK